MGSRVTRASLADVPAIKALMDRYKQEILPVPIREIKAAVLRGELAYDRGVAILYDRPGHQRYYGARLDPQAIHICQLAATTKGDGSARDVLARFFAEVGVQVFLLVKSDNHRGVAFYEKMGFVALKEVSFKTFSSFLMVHPPCPLPT